MFVAVEAVDHVREIEFQVQRAFGGGHHFQFFCGLHHVLPLFAVADEIALDVVRAVIFLDISVSTPFTSSMD